MKRQKSKIFEHAQKQRNSKGISCSRNAKHFSESKGFLTCLNCGSGEVKRKRIDFKVYGISLGNFPAEVCSKCGEEVFDEATSDNIDKIAKEKGLWGLEARTKVGIAGDGIVIRVNKRIAQFMGLKKGEEVTLLPENKRKLSVVV